MNRGFLIAFLSMLSVFATIISINIILVHNDINANDDVLELLSNKQYADMKLIKEFNVKIDRIDNDPSSVETLLLKKFKLLRKDQFIIHD